MGTDISIVLGKIESQGSVPSDLSNFSDIALQKFESDMFEFLRPDDEVSGDIYGNVTVWIPRNYDLFSWLTDARGHLKPLPGFKENDERTNAFIKWVESSNKKPSLTYLYRSAQDNVELGWTLAEMLSGYNKGMFLIDNLLSFNYDEIPQVLDEYFYDEERGEDVSTWKPHPEGKTYRELFGREYFDFLIEAKSKGWLFILVSFE